jgi:branched-chain amino acid transport system ATP-binding protein
MLELRDLTVSYGRGKVVLHEITLAFGSGELAVIMGHNGAGKTTLLKAIFGLLAPERGEITYQGEPLRGDAPGRVRRQIAYSPAGQAILPGLTVEENLAVAAEVVRADRATTRSRRETTFELFPILAERTLQRAGTLSGGQQRMLAVAMALMQGPEVLLLDEPSLGLSPLLVENLYAAIARIRQEFGLTVVVVEQSINPTILQADRLHVLRMGRIVFSGGSEILGDTRRLWSLL